MKIGVSSASLFPLHTEDAVAELARRGVKNMEIFVNSVNETSGVVFDKIRETVRENGIEVMSMHPFSSPMETLYLFSCYDRRVEEILDMYRRIFEAMNLLGAKIFVVHGAITSSKVSDDFYFQQFLKLSDVGRSMGITVAQENVSYCKSASLEFLRTMQRQLGDRARFVLDLKQAIRSGLSPFDILSAVGENICHCHISDSRDGADCLPVGKGSFDFPRFFDELHRLNYKGGAVLELYSSNYDSYDELRTSVDDLYAIERRALKNGSER